MPDRTASIDSRLSGSSGGSSRSKTAGLVPQQLAIPYCDTELLKTWLKKKFGRNFKITAYKIGSVHLLVPERQLVTARELEEIRRMMADNNHYVNPWAY